MWRAVELVLKSRPEVARAALLPNRCFQLARILVIRTHAARPERLAQAGIIMVELAGIVRSSSAPQQLQHTEVKVAPAQLEIQEPDSLKAEFLEALPQTICSEALALLVGTARGR